MATLSNQPTFILTSAAATNFPADNAEGFKVAGARGVRTFVAYDSVTACVVRLLVKNPATGAWHAGPSTDDLDALTPESGNDVRVWDVDPGDEITFQVLSMTGDGVTIHADLLEGGRACHS